MPVRRRHGACPRMAKRTDHRAWTRTMAGIIRRTGANTGVRTRWRRAMGLRRSRSVRRIRGLMLRRSHRFMHGCIRFMLMIAIVGRTSGPNVLIIGTITLIAGTISLIAGANALVSGTGSLIVGTRRWCRRTGISRRITVVVATGTRGTCVLIAAGGGCTRRSGGSIVAAAI